MNKVRGHDEGEIKLGIFDPPGELLREELEERGISQTVFAKKLNIHQPHLSDLLKGKRRISASIALKLEKELGISAEFWLNLQVLYELALEREKPQEAGIGKAC